MSKISAAVLIPLIKREGKDCILFEKRALNLSVQPGDICFPGGGVEKGETCYEAVLREACEELVINPSQIVNVNEFAVMPGPPNRRDICIFIGELLDYHDTYSLDEVDCVFFAPIDWLLDNIGSDDYGVSFDYKGFHIWGFTARVLERFLKEYVRK